MTRLKLLIALSCAGSLALAGVALGGAAHASAPSTVVTTKQSSLGPILATSSGLTLYYNSGDKPPKFACTGGCLTAWPPLLAKGTLKAEGGAKASLLGTTKGPKGNTVTYNHHPLYTFVGDSKSNPTSGEGQNGFYALNTAGAKATKTKTTTTTTTTTSTSSKKPTSTTPGY